MVKLILLRLFCLSTLTQSQVLYEESNTYLQTFNKEKNTVVLKKLLETCEANFKEQYLEKKSTQKAYEAILTLYGSKKFPNDSTISELCQKHSNLIIGSSTDCHRYYDCSWEDPSLAGWVDMYKFWPSRNLHECHYPFLFSEETLKCENYTNVDCGKRFRPVWQCRYFRLQCKLSHCQPCDSRYPSCENKTDGLWPDSVVNPSPRYVICENRRMIHKAACGRDSLWSAQQFPYNGSCVHQFAIPKDSYPHGLLPSCKGVKDGSYQYKDRPCDAYYRCYNGIATAVKCPSQTVFDVLSGTCKSNVSCTGYNG